MKESKSVKNKTLNRLENLSVKLTEVHTSAGLDLAKDLNQTDFEDLALYLKESSESLHIVTKDGKVAWANDTELDFLGYTAEDYFGRSIVEFHRDSSVISDILNRLLSGETLKNYSAYLIAKDGSVKRVLINSNGFFKDGEFVHTRCFSRDITDLNLPEWTGYSIEGTI